MASRRTPRQAAPGNSRDCHPYQRSQAHSDHCALFVAPAGIDVNAESGEELPH